MNNRNENAIQKASPIVTQATAERKDFEAVKRAFETAFDSGKDYSTELMELATAVAYSCINKCIDPQRKTATERETVSNNGINPAMLNVKRDIAHDVNLLHRTALAGNTAVSVEPTYTADGDMVFEVVDRDAMTAWDNLAGETLGDGLDLVNTAVVALLEQATDHANGENWLDTPYTVNRLSRRVYIRLDDSASYREEETTPIQEVYKAVRRAIQNSRAVQTDPRNGYLYIEDYTADGDGLETIYRRLKKHADLGGYDCSGNYTADIQTAMDYHTALEKLNLTDRQITIVTLRMQGYGNKAIAEYLGVKVETVRCALKRLQTKCTDMGFAPNGYTADK